MTDLALMRRALRLAERGRGGTSPNPMVGATVVAPDGTIVGDGYHQRAGTAHAEVHALAAAGVRARGATLFCTLEPCCHHGRTGPCTERIVASGITRVVAAMTDPNPLVSGRGFAYLREHGVEVREGVAREEARALNAAFVTFIRHRRPFVILKAGVSLDGAIAEGPSIRTAITGPRSWRHVHGLRAEVDAIGVGSDTILVDDPLLTARDVYRRRPLVRVIFDRRLRTPPDAHLFGTLDHGPVLIVTTETVRAGQADSVAALERSGAEIVATPDGSVQSALRALGDCGIVSLLLEGGGRLHRAAWEAGMIDRVMLFVAPFTMGGGLALADGAPIAFPALTNPRVEPVGDDVLLQGDVYRAD